MKYAEQIIQVVSNEWNLRFAQINFHCVLDRSNFTLHVEGGRAEPSAARGWRVERIHTQMLTQ